MTAEPLPGASVGRWPMPPQDGYTVDDFFSLPDLPPHTELIDGSPVLVSPQRDSHSTVLYLLEHGLRTTVPEHHRVRREMVAVLPDRPSFTAAGDRPRIPRTAMCRFTGARPRL